MKSRTLTDQNYVPRRKKICSDTCDDTFSCNARIINHFPAQNTKGTFILGGTTQAATKKKNFKPSGPTDAGKLTSKQNKRKHSMPKKIDFDCMQLVKKNSKQKWRNELRQELQLEKESTTKTWEDHQGTNHKQG